MRTPFNLSSELAKAEEKAATLTHEEKWRRKSVRHFKGATGGPLCQEGRAAKKTSFYSRRPRYKAGPTDDRSRVTCKCCLRKMEAVPVQ